METQETLSDCMARLGLTVRADFVPFSKSRNATQSDRSLNWMVTLERNEKDILTTDYMAGIGFCPAYKAPIHMAGASRSILRAQAIERETETGVATTFSPAGIALMQCGAVINPDPVDVVAAMALDSDVIDYRNFEEWADNLGYDPDSRKAEGIYKACLKLALSLRIALGETDFAALRAAAAEY